MNYDSSPIAAIATAPGRGGIGVVRVSGKNLEPVMQALCGTAQLQPRHATYLSFRNADGSAIDRSVEGFHARVVQHECDHLDGVLYPQRMTDMRLLMFVEEGARFPIELTPVPA